MEVLILTKVLVIIMVSSRYKEQLIISTDGSAFHNGKEDAVGGVGVFFGVRDKR